MSENLDLTATIIIVAKKLQSDPELLSNFQKSPVKAIEKLTGLDLPDEKIEPLITGIKARLGLRNIGDALGSINKLL